MRRLGPSRVGIAVVCAAGVVSCFDPVHADAVAALGGEAPGVDTGKTHRPGQPCSVCHGGQGPGPEFAFAGTVYLHADGAEPAVNTVVEIRESADASKGYRVRTNEVGNFTIERGEFDPTFPVFVALQDERIVEGTPGVRSMISPIGRDRGCGYCHVQGAAKDRASSRMPPVYLNLARQVGE